MLHNKMKELLEIRDKLKSKKPKFIRQLGGKLKNLSLNWRAPKGMHSKLRRKRRGKQNQPSIGYSSPRLVRGLHKTGLIPLIVSNKDQLNEVKSNMGAIISSRVGKRKKLSILEEAKKNKITVLNIKDLDKYITKLNDEFEKRVENKTRKIKQKEESKKEILEKTKEEKKELTQEEKEKIEKEEKRKILEARE